MKYLEKKNGLLPIGIVAKSYGISENCIRRMEAADLLKPAYISRDSGYRYYDSANVSRIGTILTLRSFGFVNEDIKEYFESSGNYSVLYGKLLKKQQTLNRLIDKMRRLPMKLQNTILHTAIRKRSISLPPYPDSRN